MAAIRVHDSAKLEWRAAADIAEEHNRELKEEFRGTHLIFHERGSEEQPQLFELRFPAGMAVDVHAHEQDEIIYVAGGTMMLGNRALKPGSSVFVGGNTLYSFAAGADGLHILNFRPRRDESHILPEEHQQARAAAR